MDNRKLPSVAAQSAIDTGGRIQAVHVYDLINIKVLIEGLVAVIGRMRIAEVAFTLYIMVHTIGYHSVVPCIINHPCLVCFIIQ